MKYVIQKLAIEGDDKLVGFDIEWEGHRLIADKKVALVEGKTDEEYIAEAYALALPEINEWTGSFENIGKEWDPDTGTFK